MERCFCRDHATNGHPVDESIDVERLARALPTVFRALIPRNIKGLKYEPKTDPVVDRKWADAIAAEYARLDPAPHP